MSASQARLLSLTARLSDLEFRAQTISNSKMRLASESEAASNVYCDALNKEKLMVCSGVDNEGHSSYIDATASNLTTYGELSSGDKQKFLKSSYGQVLVSEEIGQDYTNAAGDVNQFIYNVLGYYQEDVAENMYAKEVARINALNADMDAKYAADLATVRAANAAAQAQYKKDCTAIDAANAKALANAKAAAVAAGKFKISYDNNAIIETAGLKDAYNGGTTTLGSDSHDRWFGEADQSYVPPATIITNFTNLLNGYSESLGSKLKSNIESSIPGVSSKLDLALNYAKNATLNKFIYNIDDESSKDGIQMGTTPTWLESSSCNDKNRINSHYQKGVTDMGMHLWSSVTITVDNSQIIDTFLAYFDKYCAENFLGARPDEVGPDTTNRTGTGGTAAKTEVIFTPPATIPYPPAPVPIPDPPPPVHIPIPDPPTTPENYDMEAIKYYTNVFNEIQGNGFFTENDDKMRSPEWLYAQLKAGNMFLAEWDEDGGKDGQGDFVSISWRTGDSAIRVESDDKELVKAEAEYERTMADIQSKDKRFDLELKNVDTEHNAIQTEVDSVKQVINKNIERGFKTFDA